MNSSQNIRNTFLRFFEQKLHQIEKSAPIVVKDDPTLMFTNAGMNPFKDIFLGLKNPKYARVADTQKCLRVSGKHNDLEEVGHDTYHHTMFEMLGNWSFGDYYKAETIAWAWELLTEVFKIDKDRIYISVFGGDEKDGIEADKEAEEIWKKYVESDRILRFGKKDNFWEMGDTGPSGPCSEIHVDMRPDEERAKVGGGSLVNEDHPEVIEIWNLVFIQYNRKADQSLVELPEKHIDTGMGFERLVMVLQKKQSTYDTDLFDETKAYLTEQTGIKYEEATEEEQVAFRVIIDHIRAIAFTIGDGQIPSNTGAGYVIRRILRRAVRYGYSYLGLQQPFLYPMVAILAELYADIFEELTAQKDHITRTIKAEEESFLRTLGRGIQLFEAYQEEHSGTKEVDGAFAFKLYDTFGFPIDLTQLMARERGLGVDMDHFHKLLEEQKNRARDAGKKVAGDWTIIKEVESLPRFVGYDQLTAESAVLRFRTVEEADKNSKKGKMRKRVQLVLEETPFYAESGGQIGDRGTLTKGEETLRVLDTKKENNLIVHFVDKLPEDPHGSWHAQVDPAFRQAVMSNHSATHLVHAALREVLGEHVEQRGSLVSDQLLRFDFSHFDRVKPEEMAIIEQKVNERISQGIALVEHREMAIDEAKGMGAMALFGEKYGEKVRVIVFDPAYSVELCGGTHVPNTRDIRLFKLVSEGSVAAGIRRIEAYTGDRAFTFLNDKLESLNRIAEVMKAPADLEKAIQDLAEKSRELEKTVQKLQAEKVTQLKGDLLSQAESAGDIQVIRKVVELPSAAELKNLSFALKNETQNTLILLAANIQGKPLLSLIQSDDLAEKGTYHAGNMVRELAKEIKGGGGGQPFYATAGGKEVAGLGNTLDKLMSML
ncbi:MAG: alanine--tRNA ligase [Bacteroidota bacterium]